MSAIETRLKELGITLPDAPVIKANPALVPGVAAGGLFFCQGTLGHTNGDFPYLGKVGDKVTVEEAYQSARLCAINHLAQAKAVLKDLDRIVRVVQLVVQRRLRPVRRGLRPGTRRHGPRQPERAGPDLHRAGRNAVHLRNHAGVTAPTRQDSP